MKYYTISMFSDGTLLESITTKVAVDSMPDKTIKLLMESHDADDVDHHEDDLLAIKDSAGRDALEIAVDQGHVEFAAMLIRNGAEHADDLLKNKYVSSSFLQYVFVTV